VRLGVNVDHVATIRQARGTVYPDPVTAAALCELAGCDQITVHLREDRRHIQDRDVEILRQTIKTQLNLEMAVTDEMVRIACRVLPHSATLVPEKREERTTEGGLDVVGRSAAVERAVSALRTVGVRVSLFIDPDPAQVQASHAVGAEAIEIHTGRYCDAPFGRAREVERQAIEDAAQQADALGLEVAAGHGLDYVNVRPIVDIEPIVELNIGHSMVARAVLFGLEAAVREMRSLLVRR